MNDAIGVGGLDPASTALAAAELLLCTPVIHQPVDGVCRNQQHAAVLA